MAILQWHSELKLSPNVRLDAAFDDLVRTDEALGNVVVREHTMYQIVETDSFKRWYVSQQPERALRPGLGKQLSPRETPIFFDNVLSKGAQCWIRFRLAQTELVAYANPHPHMPGTILITKVAEDLQTWRTGCRASTLRRIRDLSGLLVELSTCVPGRYVSFNSLGAGHSLSQWHVSVNRPPHGLEELPVEQNVELHCSRSRKGLLSLGHSDGYPVPVFIAIGPGQYITERLCDVIADWDTLPAATGNLMVTKSQSGEMFTALFWPRVTLWRRAPGYRSGEIAALELSGYFPLSDEIDLAGVADGRYDYRHFWRALHATADRKAFDRCATWVR